MEKVLPGRGAAHDADIDHVAVIVQGYRQTRLDFASARYKTRLQPTR